MFKENLIINSEICDARKIKEENYESYKKIIINSEILITSERSREILNSLGAIVNSDAIIDAAEDEVIDSRIVNGNEVISKGSVPKNKGHGEGHRMLRLPEQIAEAGGRQGLCPSFHRPPQHPHTEPQAVQRRQDDGSLPAAPPGRTPGHQEQGAGSEQDDDRYD